MSKRYSKKSMQNDIYKAKNDLVFKFVFSDDMILKDFLQAVLKEEITQIKIDIDEPITITNIKQKRGVIDILATVNNQKVVDVEMQNDKRDGYVKRILLYFGGIILGESKRGSKYEDIKDVVIINILNYRMFNNTKRYYTIWNLREKYEPSLGILSGIELHILELPKFRKQVNVDLNNKLNQWLAYIDNENERWVKEAMVKNENVKRATELQQKFVTADERVDIMLAKLNKLVEEREKQINQRIEEGIKENRENMVKKLLKENASINLIMKVTDLSYEEIKQIS